MRIGLEFKSADAIRRIRRLSDRIPHVVARALNRGGGSMRTLMVRVVGQDMGVKASAAREQIFAIEATPDRLRYELRATLKKWPLIQFEARGPMPSRGRGRHVTAKVGNKRRSYPNVFLARMKSGHIGVFAREETLTRKSAGAWGPNLPIVERRGPSVGHVFSKHAAEGLARGEEQFKKNLQHELRFALQSSTS